MCVARLKLSGLAFLCPIGIDSAVCRNHGPKQQLELAIPLVPMRLAWNFTFLDHRR